MYFGCRDKPVLYIGCMVPKVKKQSIGRKKKERFTV